jgi:glycosyltransferase involved in cell wall biosynthesis
MRILIFHGYLLRGTGSNIYNFALVRALVDLGHHVDLLCQDRHADELPFVDAVARLRGGEIHLDAPPDARCVAYLPDIGRALPVYVADRYEGFDAVPFPQLDDAALDRYLEANVAAVRAVAARATPDVALANHLVMGPAILARALGGRVPYAVKVHGSALEYTVRPHRARFLPFAREGLASASGVLVGSRHTAESLFEVVDDPSVPPKTRLGPPGVDTRSFRPRDPRAALAAVRELAGRVERSTAGWGGEAGAAAALRAVDPTREAVVTFVGKLIVSKGVDLLLAAWPLVTAAVPNARLCIVGFGTYRDGLRRLAGALARGDLREAREIASRGRALEGGPPGRLTYLLAFLDRLDADPAGYLDAAPGAFERIHFTGRLEHDQLPALLAASRVQVVPSTFPEAFGMVAVEAAACGALPLSAAHSGLAEVTGRLEAALPARLRPLLSFELGPHAVEDVAEKLVRWLTLECQQRLAARKALSNRARQLFGWEGVATGVIAAAEGRLDDLPPAAP